MGESNKTQEALKKVWEKHEENLNSQRKSVADDLKEKRKQADPFQPDVLERKAMKPAFFEWLEIRFDAATKQQDMNQLVQRCDVVKAYIDQNVPIDKCTDHFKGFRDWLLKQIEYLKNQILNDDVDPLPDNPDDDPFITSTMAGQSGAAPVQDAASNVPPPNPSTPSGSSALSQGSSPSQSTTASQRSTGTKPPTASPEKGGPRREFATFEELENFLRVIEMKQARHYFDTYRQKYEELASGWSDKVLWEKLDEAYDFHVPHLKHNNLADNLLGFQEKILETIMTEKGLRLPEKPTKKTRGKKDKNSPNARGKKDRYSPKRQDGQKGKKN